MRHCGAAVLTILALPGAALAHSGHGLRGEHVHVDDVVAMVVTLAVVTLVLFAAQRSGWDFRGVLRRHFPRGEK